ncbi:hypothetical protein Z042_14605 [Chania multitudinisentens RB-25]|uniref:Lysozyme inhibitor LprI-like N-terminal domain-containing protein n=1 Tax=Chania multitudinisentens RB-25 TaxID=1441930 RepID=W0LG27_9GAMM|nr:lysozyme inhibitor LprI family protein [Chania multitudinisentens]AHG22823.1 hypothetical protein Z042_14605 [Chania multitudinisentens RB-25]
MRRVIIFVLACFPILSYSAQTLNELRDRNPQLCQDIKKEDGNSGIWECLTRLQADSEAQLKTRLKEVRAELKEIGYEPYQKAFEKDQLAWEAYKKTRCEYLTAGTLKDSVAFDLHGAMCNASENYRRIDTLKNEPPFS